jgi:rSAM/selenodomain-associated transferase 1
MPPSDKGRPAEKQQADTALVIFAKAPIPGQVKTRLCPPLTGDEAATLQGTLVLDVVERSRTVERQMDRFLACSPQKEHPFFKIMEGRHGIRTLDQIGDDIGSRMAGVFDELFGLGYRRVIMVGTDVPTLQPAVFVEAQQSLAKHDLVVGPAQDGGYFLIGMTKPLPQLFQDIPWSTGEVMALTLKKAAALGLTVAQLAVGRDLDRVDDLLAFASQVPSGKGKGQSGPISTRTAGVLLTLAERLRSRGADAPTR